MDTLFYYLIVLGFLLIPFEGMLWYIFKPQSHEYTEKERDNFQLTVGKIAAMLIVGSIVSLIIGHFVKVQDLKLISYLIANLMIIGGIIGFQMPPKS